MNKKEFKKWVDEIVKEYSADSKVECLTQGKIILVDEDTAQTGMYKCDVEHSDYRTGIAIAYAKLRGFAIPTVLEENKEPEFGRVKDGDTYWTIAVDSDGIVRAFSEEDDYCVVDDNYFNSNNYFRTRERAKEVANKINTLLKLERLHDVFCPHYKPVWNGYERNYYVRYCVDNEKWTVRYDIDYCSDVEVYFSTKMIALQVCGILNKELEMPF